MAGLVFCVLLIFALGLRHKPLQPSGSAPKQPVEGAFGFKLGEPLPKGFWITTNRDGIGEYSSDFTDAAPFMRVTIKILNDRRIQEIEFSTGVFEDSLDQVMKARGIVDSLADKYGLLSEHNFQDESKSWVFGGADKRVEVFCSDQFHYIAVKYEDYTLLDQAIEDEKVNRKVAARGF